MNGEEQVRRIVVVSGLFFTATYLLNIPFYVMWLASSDPSPSLVLKEVADKYLLVPLYLVYLKGWRGPETLRTAVRTLSLAVFLVAAPLAFYNNYFEVQGFRWQWLAVATWSLSMYMLLGLTAHAPPLKSLVISYAGVLFASVVYEIPWILAHGNKAIFLSSKWTLAGILTVLGINDYGKPSKPLLLASAILLATTFAAWNNLPTAWLARIPAVLLILSFYAGEKSIAVWWEAIKTRVPKFGN